MSEEKPALLRIERPESYGDFTAVFELPGSAGTISITVPSETDEKHMVEVARDHLHRLLQATTEVTLDWIVPDDRRQKIDPDRKQTLGFGSRGSRGVRNP
ncbi:hypothetical protein [Methylobacterium sp. Leaf399]|uniref:hypothetical protein n=1 Tax=Methylobacterium sp. Leaf399 TaxID=1736364 RepID=UPI000B26324E|nr:hypothetical protein [Methylobacterium sp. Leaf399]